MPSSPGGSGSNGRARASRGRPTGWPSARRSPPPITQRPEFCEQFSSFDQLGLGAAVLRSTSPDEFVLRIATVDGAGHMIVSGEPRHLVYVIGQPYTMMEVSGSPSIVQRCRVWCEGFAP